MIPESILNQIQERVDIVEIVSAHVPLKRAGRNFKANCPFHHEKTPSFVVNPDKQIFHCFGCGVGGNVFSFLMKLEKREFREVVELLAERTGVEIPKTAQSVRLEEKYAELFKANQEALNFYHDFLLNRKEAESARAYLKKRDIAQDTMVRFKLGFAPDTWDVLSKSLQAKVSIGALEKTGLVISKKEGGTYDRFRARVIFPILDSKGACIAFGGRVMDDSLPKYVNSPESEIYSKGRNLYGLFEARQAIRESDAAIVVEGYMDLIACHKAGVKNAVASLGTALTLDQVRLVKRNTKNVFILYDADRAGELATLRGLELFLEEGMEVKVVRLPSGHDPDSFIRESGIERFHAELRAAKTLFGYKLDLLKQTFDSRSLEGKIRIANDMVSLFSKVQNEILRALWVKELARELSLSEEALISEIGKAQGKTREAVRPAEPKRETEIGSAEKFLIGLMLDGPDFLARAREEVRVDDFQNPKARAVAKKILEETKVFSAAQWMNGFGGETELLPVVSSACAEAEMLLDKEKAFRDCVLWFKRARIKNERDGLKSQILAAQEQGDARQVHKLLYDFNELNKGMKKIYEEK